MIFLHIISRPVAKSLGMKRYFTGGACKYGHVAERLVSIHQCTQCIKERYQDNKEEAKAENKRYREENREKIAEGKKRYAEQNREKLLAYWSDRYHSKKEAILESLRRDYAENGEELREARRKRRSDNPEIHRERAAKYRKENPEKIKQFYQNRRARKVSAEGSHTHEDIQKILEGQGNKCASCTKRFTKNKKGNLLYHVDHVVPLAKGGSNWPSNLQMLCPRCNVMKSDLDPLEWAKRNGRLL